jgi:antitoxin component of MazEF toxin-antitoxin module
MRTSIRRIGNSLGVLIPRSVLSIWGLSEGDSLELTDRGIFVSTRTTQDRLDDLKRRIAVEVAATFPPALIRAHSLANLFRWEKQGSWVPAYGVWRALLTTGDDGALFSAMLGRDEHANELRQSPPYIGLLPREVTKRLNEEATG